MRIETRPISPYRQAAMGRRRRWLRRIKAGFALTVGLAAAGLAAAVAARRPE